MNRSAWRDSLERAESALEPYFREDAHGNLYLPKHPTIRRLVAHHDHLICTGLEYGWLELTKEGVTTA